MCTIDRHSVKVITGERTVRRVPLDHSYIASSSRMSETLIASGSHDGTKEITSLKFREPNIGCRS